ncbi:MAG: prepilin-type N-terminal cleavage/methylation domain-containing protein [Gemmatimonadota bacterium]|jgi:prepilin-type N-terminal cleavage/methylation domain-containing protein|nr:prepilin-type N-terminal cleavage/methylation domain-containing protein [Gemmatimonadota bacterium]
MNKRGFTLIEMLIGLVLTSVVSLSIYQVLVNNQRLHRAQTERVDLNATLRAAISVLPSEFREMNASDTASSDIAAMSATSITYKAMRTLHFICAPPVDGGSSGTIIVRRNPAFGLRGLEVGRDSLVIFAERNPKTRMDNHWVHANLTAAVTGTACLDGSASVTLTLDGVYPSGGLAGVSMGAPVRGYELLQVLTYTDGFGDVWMGARQFNKSGGWGTTQPLLGPLQVSGMQFSFFDTTGAVTTTAADVARLGITIMGMTREPVRWQGKLVRVVDTMTTHVALRNNAR